jgi:hypothetical protein
MNWNVVKRKPPKGKRTSIKAYDVEKFLFTYRDVEAKQIIHHEAKKSVAVVATIRDKGIDERNRLKAANSLLDRVIPRVERHEVEGSLTLESRLNEALEKAEGVTKDAK